MLIAEVKRVVNKIKKLLLFPACMLVVREFDKSIKAVDPKKMTTVGSFRVDPKGNQKGLVEVSKH